MGSEGPADPSLENPGCRNWLEHSAKDGPAGRAGLLLVGRPMGDEPGEESRFSWEGAADARSVIKKQPGDGQRLEIASLKAGYLEEHVPWCGK